MRFLSLGTIFSAIFHSAILAAIVFWPSVEKKPEPKKILFKINPTHIIEEQVFVAAPQPVVKKVTPPKPAPKKVVKKNQQIKKKVIKKKIVKKKTQNPAPKKMVKVQEPVQEKIQEKVKDYSPPAPQTVVKSVAKSSPPKAQPKQRASNANAKAQYISKIARILERSKYYPSSAKKRGIQGVVEIAFVVNKNGSVSGVKISKSAGAKMLDSAARKALLKAAKKFPPIPDSLNQQRLSIAVPLDYILK